MCRGVGWAATRPSLRRWHQHRAVSLQLEPCLYPECNATRRRPVAHLGIRAPLLERVACHAHVPLFRFEPSILLNWGSFSMQTTTRSSYLRQETSVGRK